MSVLQRQQQVTQMQRQRRQTGIQSKLTVSRDVNKTNLIHI